MREYYIFNMDSVPRTYLVTPTPYNRMYCTTVPLFLHTVPDKTETFITLWEGISCSTLAAAAFRVNSHRVKTVPNSQLSLNLGPPIFFYLSGGNRR
jgi:hypothetical protein